MQDKVEIVWLFRPLGAPVGIRTHQGTELNLRDGRPEEIRKALEELSSAKANGCTLFVLNSRQLLKMRGEILNALHSSPALGRVGFVLVEKDASSTVRTWKKLRLLESSDWLLGIVRHPFSFNMLMSEIQRAAQKLMTQAVQNDLSSMLALRDLEAKAINEIGLAMTSQSSVDSMVRLVLEKAIDLSSADAGFFLLRENLGATPRESGPDLRLLRSSGNRFFQKARICKSQNLKLNSELLDPGRNASISYVFNNAVGLVWEEGWQGPVPHGASASQVGQVSLPQLQFEFDPRTYKISSYCLFPLRTPSGEVVGFILLVNRKQKKSVYLDSLSDVAQHVTTFNTHDLNLLEAMAAQVGVSLDHARLIQDLKKVFESFVEASVVAIESRDPSTKGHSERVAVLTLGLAEAVNTTSEGQYASVSFNESQLYEIKYAALLHDFGKIGVRENILRKERKLYHHELMAIQERFYNLEKQLNLKCLEDYLERLMNRGQVPSREDIDRIQLNVMGISRKLQSYWESILEANEPSVVSNENFQKILEIAAIRALNDGEDTQLLLTEEVEKLTIKRGSLSLSERLEIESHVTHSFKFLISIPWTRELANVPDIVYAHHERLDGTGYPRRLVSDEIPIQAKIMAIADVYDALVAVDRPYKLALPHERALTILEGEVREKKLDPDLFKIFVEARVGELIKLPNEDEESAA
ncbi:MAG: HD domain-containing protein [Betaproteobacteria bacterium]|nr:HD domain-containing protein [Betaproteobacteria bacterium]